MSQSLITVTPSDIDTTTSAPVPPVDSPLVIEKADLDLAPSLPVVEDCAATQPLVLEEPVAAAAASQSLLVEESAPVSDPPVEPVVVQVVPVSENAPSEQVDSRKRSRSPSPSPQLSPAKRARLQEKVPVPTPTSEDPSVARILDSVAEATRDVVMTDAENI